MSSPAGTARSPVQMSSPVIHMSTSPRARTKEEFEVKTQDNSNTYNPSKSRTSSRLTQAGAASLQSKQSRSPIKAQTHTSIYSPSYAASQPALASAHLAAANSHNFESTRYMSDFELEMRRDRERQDRHAMLPAAVTSLAYEPTQFFVFKSQLLYGTRRPRINVGSTYAGAGSFRKSDSAKVLYIHPTTTANAEPNRIHVIQPHQDDSPSSVRSKMHRSASKKKFKSTKFRKIVKNRPHNRDAAKSNKQQQQQQQQAASAKSTSPSKPTAAATKNRTALVVAISPSKKASSPSKPVEKSPLAASLARRLEFQTTPAQRSAKQSLHPSGAGGAGACSSVGVGGLEENLGLR
jgi:hypothetical protein